MAQGTFKVIHIQRNYFNQQQNLGMKALNLILILKIGNVIKVIFNISNYMQKKQYSTIDLHNIQQDIYLGFLSESTFEPSFQNYDISFFGGLPVWLSQPNQNLIKCDSCKTYLSFLGQIYCPFNADYCYHRILYILFCDRCVRSFKVIRQQQSQNWQHKLIINKNVKKICDAKQIDNDSYPKSQFIKLIAKTKILIQQQEAIQEADSEEEEDVLIETKGIDYEIKQNQLKQIQEKNESSKQDKDVLFEIYKKVMSEIKHPCMLYTDTPLLYNKRPLNPQHFCKFCGSKLALQIQITQNVLNMDHNENSRLLLMDWGSLMIFTCSSSCSQSQEQYIVVQYQIDAIKEEDIKKLTKAKKNKKKKERKANSKSKEKQKIVKQESSSQGQTEEKEIHSKQGNIGSTGDWD